MKFQSHQSLKTSLVMTNEELKYLRAHVYAMQLRTRLFSQEIAS